MCSSDGVGLLEIDQVPIPPNPSDRRVGATLCRRYQVRRIVADGGMGRVYEALDVETTTRVALKVLHAEVARDEVAVERFKREFEVSKLFPHDHIVKVMDFAETDDQSYALVMEFLDGEELRATLKRERFVRPERMIPMLSQVAVALDEAHRRQLVHRDLKPDNLFLCRARDGVWVKVLDFGSVKDKASTKKLTVVGTTIGSPYYMAPEQAQGLETLDARADVWSLAAICYECLTGKVPFHGSTGPAIMLSILTKDPDPPSEAAVGAPVPIPAAVDLVMEVALAKNPAIRTRSVGQLADEFGRAYGLIGDHREWARWPIAKFRDEIQRLLPQLLATAKPKPAPAPAPAMRDPFAPSPAAGNSLGGARNAPVGAAAPMRDPFAPQAYAGQMPAAPQVSRTNLAYAPVSQQFQEERASATYGVPAEAPRWLVPLLIGTAALIVGLIGTFLVMR